MEYLVLVGILVFQASVVKIRGRLVTVVFPENLDLQEDQDIPVSLAIRVFQASADTRVFQASADIPVNQASAGIPVSQGILG